MNRTDFAFYLSIAGALIATCALGWQVVQFLLSGSRLRARIDLYSFYHVNGNSFLYGADGGFWLPHVEATSRSSSAWTSVVVKVTLVNVGRAPVDVHSVGVDTGRVKWYARTRQMMATNVVAVRDGQTGNTGTIEPGRSLTLYMDAYSVVRDSIVFGHRPKALRATGRSVLGARVLSPWRSRRMVTKSTLEQVEATAHGDHRSSRRIALFGALNTSTEFERYVVSQTLSTALREGADENRIAELVTDMSVTSPGTRQRELAKLLIELHADRASEASGAEDRVVPVRPRRI
ncbi:hypothetical protein FHX81_4828 [Saccharothrix saharensis]|uniref:Uncharacterized protein n=1 Tax=Saccharothrix saharensis TaxID=571190 RepID=A0A543JI31_9PSEU|nr:hypothetical protein [Saccharothrix saharensis]TQM82424.1 hypothetical protein FHX81_4828 [Saccharothrix saharensis]